MRVKWRQKKIYTKYSLVQVSAHSCDLYVYIGKTKKEAQKAFIDDSVLVVVKNTNSTIPLHALDGYKIFVSCMCGCKDKCYNIYFGEYSGMVLKPHGD